MKLTTTLGALAAISLTACAAAQPSSQLLDARKTITQADAGHAEEYAPSELNAAHKLLDQAEQEKDGSTEEVQFAYLADRAALRAESHGNALYFAQQAKESDDLYNKLQESGRLDAEQALEDTQEDLADVKVAAQTQMSTSKSALATSEKGRIDAEARAAAAIASLSTLANVKEEANRTVITLSGSVLFKTGESTLLPLAEDSLARVAVALKELSPERKVVIEGHTDSRGVDAMNQTLSQSRSDSVMRYLVGQGVDAGKMSAVGQGESRPIASNETAEGRANNRRVELIISK